MKANQLPPDIAPGIHLNIGCGGKLWPGFVNIDFPGNWSGKPPDVECDVRLLPFEDDHAESAWAIHVLEHFYRWEAQQVITEWVRVLKPGGRLVIEVPCLDNVAKVLHKYLEHGDKYEQMTMWRLYGDPDYEDPVMVHKWCYSIKELTGMFEQAGLTQVVAGPPAYHHPQIDMRVVGVKHG